MLNLLIDYGELIANQSERAVMQWNFCRCKSLLQYTFWKDVLENGGENEDDVELEYWS